jgi:hypothetical protein
VSACPSCGAGAVSGSLMRSTALYDPAAAAPGAASAQPAPLKLGSSDASTDGRPGPTSVSAAIAAISVRLYS